MPKKRLSNDLLDFGPFCNPGVSHHFAPEPKYRTRPALPCASAHDHDLGMVSGAGSWVSSFLVPWVPGAKEKYPDHQCPSLEPGDYENITCPTLVLVAALFTLATFPTHMPSCMDLTKHERWDGSRSYYRTIHRNTHIPTLPWWTFLLKHAHCLVGIHAQKNK